MILLLLLTLPQSRWHARKGELFAQREGTRASRRHLGRIPGDNWTDHIHLVTVTVAPDADAAVIRWIADIVSDGSRLRNLGGRSAALADGLSRQDDEHAELNPAATDLWYDDMAEAYSSLANSGARYLQLQLVRPEEQNIDTSSAPVWLLTIA
jgi:hypothetical protein